MYGTQDSTERKFHENSMLSSVRDSGSKRGLANQSIIDNEHMLASANQSYMGMQQAPQSLT